jgi:hypothetical protein
MTALTPSEVAYLLGSTYISKTDLGNDETKATQVEFAVGAVGWTKFCVAVAFAGLAQEGSVDLQYVEEKKAKLFTSRHVVATQTGETSFPARSLEFELYRSIGGKSSNGNGSDSVVRVVEHWFGKDVSKPYDVLMAVPRSRLVELGLLDENEAPNDRGKIASSLLGKPKTVREPNHELIAAKVGEMQEAAHGWQEFKKAHSEVSANIFEDISLAIKVRTRKVN